MQPLKIFIKELLRMKFMLILLALTITGCSSTGSSTDATAKAEKKQTCTSIKVTGSKMKRKICKS